jgi:hypothetical protein
MLMSTFFLLHKHFNRSTVQQAAQCCQSDCGLPPHAVHERADLLLLLLGLVLHMLLRLLHMLGLLRRSSWGGEEAICSSLGGRHAIPRRRPQLIHWSCAAATNLQADHVLHQMQPECVPSDRRVFGAAASVTYFEQRPRSLLRMQPQLKVLSNASGPGRV